MQDRWEHRQRQSSSRPPTNSGPTVDFGHRASTGAETCHPRRPRRSCLLDVNLFEKTQSPCRLETSAAEKHKKAGTDMRAEMSIAIGRYRQLCYAKGRHSDTTHTRPSRHRWRTTRTPQEHLPDTVRIERTSCHSASVRR